MTVSGASADGGRAGLVVYQDASSYLALVKVRPRGADQVQVLTPSGGGYSGPSSRETRLRIEHSGRDYNLYQWDGARGAWAQLDRLQPPWKDAPLRRLGLAGFGGQGVFEFDDFAISVKR